MFMIMRRIRNEWQMHFTQPADINSLPAAEKVAMEGVIECAENGQKDVVIAVCEIRNMYRANISWEELDVSHYS